MRWLVNPARSPGPGVVRAGPGRPDDQPGQGYLGKAGRLGQARRQAEEIVLAEMVLLEPEPGAEDEPEDMAAGGAEGGVAAGGRSAG